MIQRERGNEQRPICAKHQIRRVFDNVILQFITARPHQGNFTATTAEFLIATSPGHGSCHLALA